MCHAAKNRRVMPHALRSGPLWPAANLASSFGGKICGPFAAVRPALRTRRGIGLARLLVAGAASARRSAPHSATAPRARRKCSVPLRIRGRTATPRRSRAPAQATAAPRAHPRRAAQPRATMAPWPASRPIHNPTHRDRPVWAGAVAEAKPQTDTAHQLERNLVKSREPPAGTAAPANPQKNHPRDPISPYPTHVVEPLTPPVSGVTFSIDTAATSAYS